MCNETERDHWLYDRPHNYVDYAADENGLWIMYMRPDNDRLIVSKIEPVRIKNYLKYVPSLQYILYA